MSLSIGDKAPDFSLVADDGTTVSLANLRGKKVVLFFYPKDNTPGCTKEACDFRDNFSAFKQANIEVFGISRDSKASHLKFKTKHSLPYPLLIDENGDVCEAYGVINKKSLFGNTFLGVTRSTFLIDEHGNIENIWRKVKVPGHIAEVLKTSEHGTK